MEKIYMAIDTDNVFEKCESADDLSLTGTPGLKQSIMSGLRSGFLVFLSALPLSLGIAKASGIPNPVFGVITAIIGGLIAALLSGSRLKSPAIGLIPVVLGCTTAFGGGNQGWHLALGCMVAAALLQILFGLFRRGDFFSMFPTAVVNGFLVSIGIMIIIKQIPVLFGVEEEFLKNPETAPVDAVTGITDLGKAKYYDLLVLLKNMPSVLSHYNRQILIIGVISLLLVFGFSFLKNKFFKKIPVSLIVIMVSVLLSMLFTLKNVPGALVKTGKMTSMVSTDFIKVDFSGISNNPAVFVKWVILLVLAGSIESLTTLKVIDNSNPRKRISNVNKDLTAMGIGNALSGLLGGGPMVAEKTHGSTNIKYRTGIRWTNFFQSLFLSAALLTAVPVIEAIPFAALAALLIYGGYRLMNPGIFKRILYVGIDQFAVLAVTLFVCLTDDLLTGILTGTLLELILNVISGASTGNLFISRVKIKSTGNYINVKVNGDAVFSNLPGLKRKIYAVDKGKQVMIDLLGCKVIDHTSLRSLREFKHQYEKEGGSVLLTGLELHSSKGRDDMSTRVRK